MRPGSVGAVAAVATLAASMLPVAPADARAAPVGASLVADLLRGGDGSSPRDLTAVGATVYFTARDAQHGRELWRSDGTAAGTTLVKDIATGRASADPGELTA